MARESNKATRRIEKFEEQSDKPAEKEIQSESMDDELRNSLWNVIYADFFSSIRVSYLKDNRWLHGLVVHLWSNHFKIPADSLPSLTNHAIERIKDHFLNSTWNDVYDFMEFLATVEPPVKETDEFLKHCNIILEREFSGYRFVGSKLAKITSKEELAEIDEATQSGITSVKSHLETATSMLSDKKSPDYRNSIKESISAVESICKLIAGDPNATMTQALKQIEDTGKIELHQDMKDAFQKLYWYTSDADGIRHSLSDGKIPPDFDDAKFMLVSCSAIVNYLISKANKVGIKLQ